MCIMKFGGTSVATVERLTTVARLVTAGLEREASSASRVVVVASALNGVTDRLAELVDQGESGTVSDPDGWTVDAVEGLRRRHRTLLERVATDGGTGAPRERSRLVSRPSHAAYEASRCWRQDRRQSETRSWPPVSVFRYRSLLPHFRSGDASGPMPPAR